MKTPTEILQHYWGFNSFRKPQKEIILSVLEKNDTVALLPTGGGKSMCFQIPALAKDGICIVVSPLIALMQDQVQNLNQRGIKAKTIPSGSSQDEIITLFDNLRFGNFKFLYISPERIQSKFIQEKIKQLNVSLIAIDEAHCISEWGHDFRPSYRNIAILKEIHPQVNIIALTASATQEVLNDIILSLHLKQPKVFKKSFFRENLAYQIYETEDKLYKLKQIVTKIKAPIIVYVNTRKKTAEISAFLNANNFKSGFYHGGLSSVEKKIAFNDWMTEKTPIIVATNAFGMGIDKPNVRVVIHLNLPYSIENYMQEAGRGGRDGNKAFSVVLINNNDILLAQELLEKSYPTIKEIKTIHKKLYQHFQIAKGELIETPFDFDFLDFCSKYTFIPNKTFNGLQLLHNNGVLQLNQSFNKKSTIRFLVNSNSILQYANINSERKNFIKALLRMYGGLFENAVKIDEFFLAKKAKITSWAVIRLLKELDTDNLIEYNQASSNAELLFLLPREDDKTINRIAKNIEAYLKQKHKKTKELIQFVENNEECRSIQILRYFGEKTFKNCNICDVCLQKKPIKNNSEHILQLIKKHKEISSKEICSQINANEADILANLRMLLSEQKIGLNTYNKYYIIQN